MENRKKERFFKNINFHSFWIIVIFRIINICFIRTWFVPDEYWQSLEVAHHMIFGFGYLTWEWKEGLRSYFHPLIFSGLYKILYFLNLDNNLFLIQFSPRLLQAFLSSISDWCFYQFIYLHFGRHIANLSLFCLFTSWFWWYCATRTLINTFEVSLVCFASLYYSKHIKNGFLKLSSSFILFVVIATLTFFVRPTSLSVWFSYFIFYLIYSYKTSNLKVLLKIISIIFITAFPNIILLIIIDKSFYEKWILVHLNFLNFNVINNQGIFYGEHPWYWYFTQGLPVVIFSQLPFSFGGIIKCLNLTEAKDSFTFNQRFMFKVYICTIVMSLFIYSLPGHKEFRFILISCRFPHFSLGFLSQIFLKKLVKN